MGVLLHAAACGLAAWYLFQATPLMVYPEYSIYYSAVYDHRGAPSGVDLLDEYDLFSGSGWYRPTTVFLVPTLLPADLTRPREVVARNVLFLALAAFLGPALFLSRASWPAKVYGSLLLLSSPALVDVFLFPCPDALYVVFGGLFLYFLARAYRASSLLGPSLPLAVAAFLLTMTSKEIGVLAAVMAPLLLAAGQGPPRGWRLTALSAPFLVLSGAFYLFLQGRLGDLGGSYSRLPDLERLDNLVHMTAFVSNLKLPATWSYPGWATTGYSGWTSVVWGTVWVVAAAQLWWLRRSLEPRRALLVVAMAASPLPVVALLGGQPHHAFATLAVASVGLAALWQRTAERLQGGGRSWILRKGWWAVAAALCLGLVLAQGATLGNLLTSWRMADVYRYDTALFQDERFHEVAQRRDTHLVVEECPDRWATGCFVGVRPYLGRAGWSGREEYVEEYDPAALPGLVAAHPGEEIWLVDCRWGERPPYAVRKLWPEGEVAGWQ